MPGHSKPSVFKLSVSQQFVGIF